MQAEIAKILGKSKKLPLDFAIEYIGPASLTSEALRILAVLIREYHPANILEFGCGFSTLFICHELNARGYGHLYSVENIKFFLDRTRSLLGETGNVTFFHCPLRRYWFNYRAFVTYSDHYLGLLPPGTKLDLVLIDGPYGRIFSRTAPLLQIVPFLSANAWVLLDDSNREREQNTLLFWQKLYGENIEIVNLPNVGKGFAIIRIREPNSPPYRHFSILEIIKSIFESWRELRENRRYMERISLLDK